MTDKALSNRRNFGGKGKEDWYYLYEVSGPKRGLTPSDAENVKRALSAVGYSVERDPLGGGGRIGIYYRKSGTKDIEFHTVPPSMIKDWFRRRTGSKRDPTYESMVSNFMAQNPHLICGKECGNIQVWREQRLEAPRKNERKIVDIILETEEHIWIVEVKFTIGFTGAVAPLEKSSKQVRQYQGMIRRLGWWKDRKIRLCIVWGVMDGIPTSSLYSSLYEKHLLQYE